jgi:hypothetical protein
VRDNSTPSWLVNQKVDQREKIFDRKHQDGGWDRNFFAPRLFPVTASLVKPFGAIADTKLNDDAMLA